MCLINTTFITKRASHFINAVFLDIKENRRGTEHSSGIYDSVSPTSLLIWCLERNWSVGSFSELCGPSSSLLISELFTALWPLQRTTLCWSQVLLLYRGALVNWWGRTQLTPELQAGFHQNSIKGSSEYDLTYGESEFRQWLTLLYLGLAEFLYLTWSVWVDGK